MIDPTAPWSSMLPDFLAARYGEEEADVGPLTVWQLDHDGFGRSLHATAEHAKAEAERRETVGGSYWRYDENYWFKRDGETIATLERVPVLGADPTRVHAELAAKRRHVAMWLEAREHLWRALDWLYAAQDGDEIKRASHNYSEGLGMQAVTEELLRVDASLYVDHPGFLAEWKIDD